MPLIIIICHTHSPISSGLYFFCCSVPSSPRSSRWTLIIPFFLFFFCQEYLCLWLCSPVFVSLINVSFLLSSYPVPVCSSFLIPLTYHSLIQVFCYSCVALNLRCLPHSLTPFTFSGSFVCLHLLSFTLFNSLFL